MCMFKGLESLREGICRGLLSHPGTLIGLDLTRTVARGPGAHPAEVVGLGGGSDVSAHRPRQGAEWSLPGAGWHKAPKPDVQ